MRKLFKISGLDCANCASDLEGKIRKIDGVSFVSINFITQKMILEYNDDVAEAIVSKVKKLIKKEEPDVVVEMI